MNKINRQLYDAIDNTEKEEIEHSAIYYIDIDEASENCFNILQEHCVGFILWQQEKGYSRAYELDTWFKGFGNKIANSTQDLFNLYLKSLNNE